jgi:parallel beta-helix repeat protein
MSLSTSQSPSRLRVIGFFGALVLIVGTATLRAPMAFAASIWWVDNTSAVCSDTGPGTSDTPLCTISKAAARATSAGDQVRVRPGTYAEQVTVAASGATGGPVTFTATAPGVVVLGTRDLSDATGWTATAGTAWSHAYAPPSNPRQVFRDDVRLPAAASLAALSAGQFFYDTANHLLYVDAGGANPADGHTVAAGAQTYGFNLVARSNVVVDGFTFKRQNYDGVRLSGSSADTVRNVTATEAGVNGILLESATSNVTVTGSTVTASASAGIRLSATSGSRITGNTSRANNFHGISLATSPDNVIEGNETADNRVPTGTSTAAGIDVNASVDNVVRGNLTHGNQDSGVQIYAGSHRALVIRNISYGNGDHGLDTYGSTNVTYLSNTSHGNRKDGISVEGVSTNATLRNNISVDNGLSTNEFDIYVEVTSSPGFTADSDIVWNSAPRTAVKIGYSAYLTLAAYAAATGQEAQGRGQDPSFIDASGGDFALAANSPAIDSTDAAVAGFEATDREGTAAVDDPNVPDTGHGTPAYADRGALERTPLAADPADAAPHAALVLSVTNGQVPPAVTVTADATGSGDVDATGIASYTFDFGDGTVVGPQPGGTAVHDYTTTGLRTVTVTVADTGGATSAAQQVVTLTSRPLVGYQVDNADPSCSDTGNGSSTPFCSIAPAAAAALAGDTVWIHPGTYREQVTPAHAGMSGAPLAFRATAPGVRVVGTSNLSDEAGWAPAGATAWSRPLAASSPVTQVLSDGLRLAAATGTGTMTAGSFFYDSTAGQLYVDAGGPNPAIGHVIEAGSRTYGFKLWKTHDVLLDGIATWGQNGPGVSVQDSTRMTVSGVTAELASSYGISFDRSSAVTVTGATALDNGSIGIRFGSTSGSVISGSSTHDNLYHGISLQNSTDDVVAGNEAYGNSQPAQRVATGIDVSLSSTGVTVERNTTYGNQDSGIQIYSDSSNAIVRRNVSYDNGDHGLDCYRSLGDTVVGNTVVGNGTAGINLEGGCSGSVVANNISSDNAVGSTRTVADIRLDPVSYLGSAVDRNVVFMTSGGTLYEWNQVRYTTEAQFRAATGQETSGIGADPLFRDLAAHDLRLQGGSPAIDNADLTAQGAVARDHDGRDPVDHPRFANTGAGTATFADRGALEYHGAAAVLSVTPGRGTLPLTVTADASASAGLDGAIASYSFSCGKGTLAGPQASATTTCSYPAAGVFTVTVTVTDVNGVSDQAKATVTAMVNTAPVASLTATPTSGTVPLTVLLDATGSYDKEVGPLTYALDCGDGTAAVTAPTRTCVYTKVTKFTARVTVKDPSGLTSAATRTITAKANQAPVAALTLTPSSDYAPATVTLDASGSGDPEGGPLTYSLTCGNGMPAVLQARTTCTYPTVGTFTARATVTDDHGATSSISRTVTSKADVAPTVVLASIGQVRVNQQVLVDASHSTDPDRTPIASYRFECGNGVVSGPSGSGPAATATCRYLSAGTYTIRVTATDTIGKAGTTTASVRVR